MPPLLPAAFSGPRSSASSATPSGGGGGFIDFQLQNDIPASSFISVLVGDAVNPGLGDVPQVIGVTDSATNAYTVDDQNTEVFFGADIFMASCVNAQALSSGDTITLQVDQWPWTSFYLLVVAFTDAVTGLDATGVDDGNNYAAPAGGSLAPNVTPTTTTDLLIGVAVYGTPVTDDPAWTHVLYANDATDYMTVAYRQTSTTALVPYATSSAVPTDSATYYGGSSCCAYRLGPAPPPPPGMSTVVVGNQTYGLRER